MSIKQKKAIWFNLLVYYLLETSKGLGVALDVVFPLCAVTFQVKNS